MGNRNSIKKRVSSPLTSPDSPFYCPDYRVPCAYKKVMKMRESPLFPRARCIFVIKSWESKEEYRLLGTRRLNRYYGIGILTDENRYYYNEYRMKNTILSSEVFADLTKIFIDGYIIDKNTMFMTTSNMYRRSEPIMAFFKVIARLFNNRVRTREIYDICNILNRRLGRVFNNDSGRDIDSKNLYRFRDELLKKGWLDFVGKEQLAKLTDDGISKAKRNVALHSAIGILYMHTLELELRKSGNDSFTI